MTEREALVAFNMVESVPWGRIKSLADEAGGSYAKAWTRFAARDAGRFGAIDPRTELERAEKMHVTVLTRLDQAYPAMLNDLPEPPVCLYVSGNVQALSRVSIAMVGTRAASPYGLDAADLFAHEFAARGVNVISGLALGIDGASHEGALKAGGGLTVGILGGALDAFYPEENRPLARRIVAEGGAVVSEYPFGRRPDRGTFPRRNRIVAALSKGVLAVESPVKSGTLITCQIARSLGRPVMAIPGKFNSKFSAGCHGLVRSGAARLVVSVDEAMVDMGLLEGFDVEQAKAPAPRPVRMAAASRPRSVEPKPMDPKPVKPEPKPPEGAPLSLEEAAVLKAIPESGTHIDRVCEALSISPMTFDGIAVSLRMKGFVKFLPGGRIGRVVR